MSTVKDNNKAAATVATDANKGADATTQPNDGNAAVSAPSGDLDALAKLRAEWDEKKNQLDQDRQALDAMAADLEAQKQQLESDRQALEAREAQTAGLPSAAEMAPGEFRMYYLDDKGILVSSHYPDIDALINEMKVFRRDMHMYAAQAAGLEVYVGDVDAV